MSDQFFVAKASVAAPPATAEPVSSANSQSAVIWIFGSVVLLILLIGLAVFGKFKLNKLEKKLKFEQFRTREAQKKLKMALEIIRKIEANPDLVNSRELNLDYLRMRMAEDVFHVAIINQIKAKVKDKISQALRRPSDSTSGVIVGIAAIGRQIEEILEVEYQTGVSPHLTKCVLFRVQIRLTKLPSQTTSTTVKEIIDCIETYLSPAESYDTWQPTIQGRLVYIQWDQKAKPTPVLVIEQSNEGINVSFRTKRQNSGSKSTSAEKKRFA